MFNKKSTQDMTSGNILKLILTFSISLGVAFAQIKDMSAGAFFNFEPTAGDLSEFVMASIGGGASLEVGIPLPFLENFGASYRMTFDGGIIKDPRLDSLFLMRHTIGAYTRIPLPG